jgi:hypothetical protein
MTQWPGEIPGLIKFRRLNMANTVRFSSSHGIVPLVVPLADNYNAGMTMDSVNMANYNHCTIILVGSDSCAGAGVLTIYGATPDAGTTAAITFTYRISSGDAGAASGDVLGSASTSAALTLVEASIKSGMYVIEIDAEDLCVSGTQYQYITPVLSAAGTAGIVSTIAILSEPRFQTDVMPTAIPTT